MSKPQKTPGVPPSCRVNGETRSTNSHTTMTWARGSASVFPLAWPGLCRGMHTSTGKTQHCPEGELPAQDLLLAQHIHVISIGRRSPIFGRNRACDDLVWVDRGCGDFALRFDFRHGQDRGEQSGQNTRDFQIADTIEPCRGLCMFVYIACSIIHPPADLQSPAQSPAMDHVQTWVGSDTTKKETLPPWMLMIHDRSKRQSALDRPVGNRDEAASAPRSSGRTRPLRECRYPTTAVMVEQASSLTIGRIRIEDGRPVRQNVARR